MYFSAKVQFILSGDDDETVVRTLEDTKRKLFRRNAADTFVMTTPRYANTFFLFI